MQMLNMGIVNVGSDCEGPLSLVAALSPLSPLSPLSEVTELDKEIDQMDVDFGKEPGELNVQLPFLPKFTEMMFDQAD